MEYILCAAVWHDDGKKYQHQPKNVESGLVVCGRRHHNCFYTIFHLLGNEDKATKKFAGATQGFVTSEDRFVTRAEAYHVAKAAGQLKHDAHDRDNLILISEDLY